jgi:lysozyme family protein
MQADYDRALAIVFENEGGYVNSPHDPGGETNFGITQRVYTAWRPASHGEALTVRRMSRGAAAAIYRAQYADAIRFDELPPGVDLCTLDEAVNSGPVRAIQDLQRAVGIKADGHLGLLTMQAVAGKNDIAAVVNHMCAQRLGFLRALRNWRYFGKGWGARVTKVRAAALAMLS